jgi:hypothetical protein
MTHLATTLPPRCLATCLRSDARDRIALWPRSTAAQNCRYEYPNAHLIAIAYGSVGRDRQAGPAYELVSHFLHQLHEIERLHLETR